MWESDCKLEPLRQMWSRKKKKETKERKYGKENCCKIYAIFTFIQKGCLLLRNNFELHHHTTEITVSERITDQPGF